MFTWKQYRNAWINDYRVSLVAQDSKRRTKHNLRRIDLWIQLKIKKKKQEMQTDALTNKILIGPFYSYINEARRKISFSYYTQCQKQWVIFWSPLHQHNAHTVPSTVTESQGFGTVSITKGLLEFDLGLIVKLSLGC